MWRSLMTLYLPALREREPSAAPSAALPLTRRNGHYAGGIAPLVNCAHGEPANLFSGPSTSNGVLMTYLCCDRDIEVAEELAWPYRGKCSKPWQAVKCGCRRKAPFCREWLVKYDGTGDVAEAGSSGAQASCRGGVGSGAR